MTANQVFLVHSQLKDSNPDRSEFALQFTKTQDVLRQEPYRLDLNTASTEQLFTETDLPFHAEFWILKDRQSGQFLGRISANLSNPHPQYGFLGFFEAVDFSAAQALIFKALDWLKAMGASIALGPINLYTWLPYRFRVKSDGPTFGFEPVHPPEYPLWFQEIGFQSGYGYHSDGLDGLESMVESTESDYKNALSLGYSFRIWNSSVFFEQEVPKLYEISMNSFQKNDFFVPIGFNFFRELYSPLKHKPLDLSLSLFICNSEGKDVGFFFNFLDSGYSVMKTIALLTEARGLRLSNALIHASFKEAFARGVNQSVAALIRDGLQSESYSKKQKKIWRNNYEIFKINL